MSKTKTKNSSTKKKRKRMLAPLNRNILKLASYAKKVWFYGTSEKSELMPRASWHIIILINPAFRGLRLIWSITQYSKSVSYTRGATSSLLPSPLSKRTDSHQALGRPKDQPQPSMMKSVSIWETKSLRLLYLKVANRKVARLQTTLPLKAGKEL